MCYYLRVLCGYGGTGRRDRLRIYCQRRGGSSPLSRTIDGRQNGYKRFAVFLCSKVAFRGFFALF